MDQSARNGFLEKFNTGHFTEEEHEAFVNWVKQAGQEELEAVWEQFSALDQGNPDHEAPSLSFREALERRLDEADRLRRIPYFKRYAAASVVVLLAGASVFYFLNRKDNTTETKPAMAAKINLPPGGNKAILTLSDGKTITLDDIQSGQLALENGVTVKKDADGKLNYTVTGKAGHTGETVYNTLTTPRGGQYQVNLPDGSKVWLNAASSLSFPVNFTGKQRKVSITGEAYFEITKNRNQPFIVQTDRQEVEVLGTAFNVNSYDEASIRTSLVDGSVRVSSRASGQQTILQPGKQSVLDGQQLLTNNFDMENVTAWKKGLFSYTNASLKTVMADFERWYDVEVVIEGNIPDFDFTGQIPRSFTSARFLEIMSVYQLKFRLDKDGNKQKLIVTAP
ncbi:MAG: FecR domain-containing protein [Chitinophagaceae bacterium]|nr:FecR domain-containing protein [Chitinophagaceae bacterium]